jgi:hypothetical protein
MQSMLLGGGNMASPLDPGSRIRTFIANVLVAGPALFLAWLIIWSFTNPPPPETAEQNRVRAEAQAAVQQRAESERHRRQNLCQQQALCRKFGEARQACATAGSYKTCTDIKMGDDAMDLYPCTNNRGRVGCAEGYARPTHVLPESDLSIGRASAFLL